MKLRATAADDLPILHELFVGAIADVYRPHGFEPPAPSLDVFAAQQEHLLRHDGARCVVALDRGRPVAFASAWLRGRDWFLASLFVAASAQARGLGTALLDAVWTDGALRRRTLTDAIQPVSNALYGRRGLVPTTPMLPFHGVPHRVPERRLAVGDASPAEIAAIDDYAYGFDRAVDHALWAGAGVRTVWADGERAVAYSYVFPGGTIGPVAGLDPHAAAGALRGELDRADGEVRVRVPGSSRALVACALEAGLRLLPTPGLLLLSDGVEPPDALAIGGYTLY
ncbi:MAG TPA: GNAT family N-acetyltransferase [Gaiellaceae bacterium]|nr:GNAT family N-acetyltransferase [Gaiellaceae bacterium]